MVLCWEGYWMKVDFPREENWGGNCVFICLFGDVRRNRRQDTLDFMYGNMIGSKIVWGGVIYETCFTFQAWLIHPRSGSNFKPTLQLNLIVIISISWHQWVTSCQLVSLGCMPLNAIGLVFLGFLVNVCSSTPGGHVMQVDPLHLLQQSILMDLFSLWWHDVWRQLWLTMMFLPISTQWLGNNKQYTSNLE